MEAVVNLRKDFTDINDFVKRLETQEDNSIESMHRLVRFNRINKKLKELKKSVSDAIEIVGDDTKFIVSKHTINNCKYQNRFKQELSEANSNKTIIYADIDDPILKIIVQILRDNQVYEDGVEVERKIAIREEDEDKPVDFKFKKISEAIEKYGKDALECYREIVSKFFLSDGHKVTEKYFPKSDEKDNKDDKEKEEKARVEDKPTTVPVTRNRETEVDYAEDDMGGLFG